MTNFFIAGTLVYMGTIVLEGVSMSLTSKVCPQLALSLLSAVPRQQTQMLQHQSMILASSSLLDVCTAASQLFLEHASVDIQP